MIQFKITDNKGGQPKIFHFEESLTEVTLRRFIDYKEKVETKKPESLIKMEEASDAERTKLISESNVVELSGLWNDYNIEFVKFWTGIPEELFPNIPIEDVLYIYRIINNYFSNINIDETATSFEFNGELYLFPDAPVNPYSEEKDYMKSNKMIDVIEAMQFEMFSDALGESKWSVLPSIIAILCKKKGEQLPIKSAEREQWISKRAKLFESLPVDKALNAAFFLLRRKTTFGNDSSKYSVQQAEESHTLEPLNSGRNTDGIQPLSKSQKVDSSINQI